MKRISYPYWPESEDAVVDRIGERHFVTLELRDGGSGAITLTELTEDGKNRLSFRNYFDVAMMDTEHFKLQLEYFLRDATHKGLHHIFDDGEVVTRIIAHKLDLEARKASKIASGVLHCGQIHDHGGHYHMEGPNGYFCEGWSND